MRRPLLLAVGGALWVPYGVLELVQPFGADTRYDEEKAYDVVVDRLLFTAYSLPGSLALLLCAAGLLLLTRRARPLVWVALALGAAATVGVLVGVDPLFTGSRVLGTLLLGVAAVLAARDARNPQLLIAGVLALLLMPLWPLVFAVQWVPAAAGAAVIAAHGTAWAAVGLRSAQVPA